MTSADQDGAATFERNRSRLQRVAYRMLGSVADAEDVVQDAFMRWRQTDRAHVRDPDAFLSRVVTRLCLDVLKSARRKRETYIGPWLPDPVIDDEDDDVADVTLPLMLALERLSPLERAAFLLHDVFGVGFDEVARAIGREPSACRQLAARARAHVRAERPRYQVEKQRGLEIAAAFFNASRSGDMRALQEMLAADVVAYSDGGGKKPAAMKPVIGFDDVLRLQGQLAKMFANHMSRIVRYGVINGLPGFVTIEKDDTLQTTALHIEDNRIVAIYITRNPDKLRHLPEAATLQ